LRGVDVGTGANLLERGVAVAVLNEIGKPLLRTGGGAEERQGGDGYE
jgi:hypothetical protein